MKPHTGSGPPLFTQKSEGGIPLQETKSIQE